jgi:hypothetical protein
MIEMNQILPWAQRIGERTHLDLFYPICRYCPDSLFSPTSAAPTHLRVSMNVNGAASAADSYRILLPLVHR